MIRVRLPSVIKRNRMRRKTKLQILLIVGGGFLAGYLLLPSFYQSPTDHYEEDKRSHNSQAKPLIRVRDGPAIEFSPSGEDFIVEGKTKRILSGAIHYFRVVPDYWEDRLMKLKAAGLNTVETYVAWNRHEPIPGHFDFVGILDIREYILTAQKLGLHVIVRPGPYICSEWELGGLPSWLLRDPNMKLRTPYQPYLKAVKKYFAELFKVLVPLQSIYGGPIIAFQIENEFAHHPHATVLEAQEYMDTLYLTMRRLGVEELMFTSDGQFYLNNSLPLRPSDDVLLTVNFMNDKGAFTNLKRVQPDKPLMVMEFWSGWFFHWGDQELARNQDVEQIADSTEAILKAGGSLNYYMFHGGTNFGFYNGANWMDADSTDYQPTITSYDYDAPVSECGDITEKYHAIRDVLVNNVPESLPVNPLPPIPPNLPKATYGEVKLTLFIPLINAVSQCPPPLESERPLPMEYLEVNEGWGQSYGYALYRTLIPAEARQVTVYGLRDFGVALVDSKPIRRLSFFDFQSFQLPKNDYAGQKEINLDIIVENAGRVNYGTPLEVRKGINGRVEVDGVEHKHWKIYSFEFPWSFVANSNFGGLWERTPVRPSMVGPAIYKGNLHIQGKPQDTFIDMKGWGKGAVFINSVNMGRYWNIGPQRTLYVPAPILKRGINTVVIFELHQPKAPQSVFFMNKPILIAGAGDS